jgi:hypothetical protein
MTADKQVDTLIPAWEIVCVLWRGRSLIRVVRRESYNGGLRPPFGWPGRFCETSVCFLDMFLPLLVWSTGSTEV